MSINPQTLLPLHKSDIQNAQAILALGYPAIAPVLPELMTWLQDINWPVASVLAPFLASIEEPLFPEIRNIFRTNDEIWKYWVLLNIVDEWPIPLIKKLKDDLTVLSQRLSNDSDEREVNTVAKEILKRLENA